MPDSACVLAVNAHSFMARKQNQVFEGKSRGEVRVLLVGPSAVGGGAEKHFRLLAGYLFDGNSDAIVLSQGSAKRDECAEPFVDLGWQSEWSYPRMIVQLRRTIVRGRYDAILGFGSYPYLVAWLATRWLWRRPALILVEITRPVMQKKWARGGVREKVVEWLRRMAYRRADFFGANSKDGLRECIEAYGIDGRQAVRLRNIVERDYCPELTQGANEVISPIASNPPVICVVARLDQMKRIETLFEAVSLLQPCHQCKIRIVGDGPHRLYLERYAESRGLSAVVEFVGWIDDPEVEMRDASVLVLTSDYEGFPNSALEGMCYGIPVVTSYWGEDAREMCCAGAAVGFAPGDVQSLLRQIERVLSDESLRRKLIHCAAEYVRSFEVANAILDYEMLVRQAITHRRRPQE
jgi:glycosyltransferase involved in cell wall biosynthesis